MSEFLWYSALCVLIFGGVAWWSCFYERNCALFAAQKEVKEGRDDGEFFIYLHRKKVELIVRYGVLFITLILLIISFYFYYQPLVCKG